MLQAGPASFLGLVDGFPQSLAEPASVAMVELHLGNALRGYLSGLAEPLGRRMLYDNLPSIRAIRIRLVGGPGRMTRYD